MERKLITSLILNCHATFLPLNDHVFLKQNFNGNDNNIKHCRFMLIQLGLQKMRSPNANVWPFIRKEIANKIEYH